MEKNWIEEIKEFIRKAMNNSLRIEGSDWGESIDFSIYNNCQARISISISSEEIRIDSPKGHKYIPYMLTKRDKLELNSMLLAIEEYNEDMAESEFENFFNEENKSIDINDLNDDDE